MKVKPNALPAILEGTVHGPFPFFWIDSDRNCVCGHAAGLVNGTLAGRYSMSDLPTKRSRSVHWQKKMRPCLGKLLPNQWIGWGGCGMAYRDHHISNSWTFWGGNFYWKWFFPLRTIPV
jgi:hypothetical protein